MAPASSRRLAWLLAAALQCTALTQALSARAASALAAWAFTEEGVLKLRTSRNARLEAFLQAASDGRGTRGILCPTLIKNKSLFIPAVQI